MAGINKVILVGNLGNDPELKSLPNGNNVATFSLATSETWKDKATGERREETEWHRCVVFGKLADIVSQYTRKGSKIYAEGKIKTRQWEKDGVKQYSTEIVVSEIQMLDARKEGDSTSKQVHPANKSPYAEIPAVNANDDFDDIPF